MRMDDLVPPKAGTVPSKQELRVTDAF